MASSPLGLLPLRVTARHGSVRARSAAREPGAYAGTHLRDDERLPDVIGHPGGERVDHVLMPGPRRDHDHRRRAVTLVGAEPPADLDAVTAWHPAVQEHKVG